MVEIFSVNRWKKFESVYKTKFHVSRQSFEEIGIFSTVFGFFSQLSGFKPKEIGLLAKNFWQDGRNYFLRDQKFIFRKDFFCKNNLCKKYFRNMNGKNCDFWRYFFPQDCRNYFLPVQKVFPEEICFWMKIFLKPNIRSWVEVIRLFDISFREEFLEMPSLCAEEPLVKTIFWKIYKILS